MLSDEAEAEDIVQQAWLRLQGSDQEIGKPRRVAHHGDDPLVPGPAAGEGTDALQRRRSLSGARRRSGRRGRSR